MNPSALPSLSNRERECLRLVARGLQTKEIAAQLGLSPDTVDEYIGAARLKLGAPNRRVAARALSAADEMSAARVAPAAETAPAAEVPPSAFETIPQRVGEDPTGVTRSAVAAPSVHTTQEGVGSSWPWPLRRPGGVDSEIGTRTRLLWMLLIAVGLAIGFGMLASGLGVIAELFRGSVLLRR